MKYKAAAFDYDGTLASQGEVAPQTIIALERIRASGRKLVLVTGRFCEDIKRVFPAYTLFDKVVAENGGLLCPPEGDDVKLLAQPADRLLVEELAERGVQPLAVGRCIIATYVENKTVISNTIQELGLDYSLIFNKEHVMALPLGVDKASGLREALKELGLTPDQAIGVGDAENDEVMLAVCGFGVAVQNATPALKVIANYICNNDHGAGIVEATDLLLSHEFTNMPEQ